MQKTALQKTALRLRFAVLPALRLCACLCRSRCTACKPCACRLAVLPSFVLPFFRSSVPASCIAAMREGAL